MGLEALHDAGVVAAAIDGELSVNELTHLRELFRVLLGAYDEDALQAAARGSK